MFTKLLGSYFAVNGSGFVNSFELRFDFLNESSRWEPQQAGSPHPLPLTTSQQHYRKLVSACGVCKVCSSDDQCGRRHDTGRAANHNANNTYTQTQAWWYWYGCTEASLHVSSRRAGAYHLSTCHCNMSIGNLTCNTPIVHVESHCTPPAQLPACIRVQLHPNPCVIGSGQKGWSCFSVYPY